MFKREGFIHHNNVLSTENTPLSQWLSGIFWGKYYKFDLVFSASCEWIQWIDAFDCIIVYLLDIQWINNAKLISINSSFDLLFNTREVKLK